MGGPALIVGAAFLGRRGEVGRSNDVRKETQRDSAAVVCVDENDLQGLARIHTALGRTRHVRGLPEALEPLTAGQVAPSSGHPSDGDNPASLLQDFVRVVTCMLHIADMGDAARPDEIAAVLAEASVESASRPTNRHRKRLRPNAAATQNAAQTAGGHAQALVRDGIRFHRRRSGTARRVRPPNRSTPRTRRSRAARSRNQSRDKENINAISSARSTQSRHERLLAWPGSISWPTRPRRCSIALVRVRFSLPGGYADLAPPSSDMLRQLSNAFALGPRVSRRPSPKVSTRLLAQLDGGEEPAVDAPKPLRVRRRARCTRRRSRRRRKRGPATTGRAHRPELNEEGVANRTRCRRRAAYAEAGRCGLGPRTPPSASACSASTS